MSYRRPASALAFYFAAFVAQQAAGKAHTCISLLDTISVPGKLLDPLSKLLYLHHLLISHLPQLYTAAGNDPEVCKLFY